MFLLFMHDWFHSLLLWISLAHDFSLLVLSAQCLSFVFSTCVVNMYPCVELECILNHVLAFCDLS
jgi:hypothetical protein